MLSKAKAHDLTRRFIGVVARNRRLFAVPAMIGAYLAILAERRGEVAVLVVSAVKLTAAQATGRWLDSELPEFSSRTIKLNT